MYIYFNSHIFFFTWRNSEGVCDVFMEEMQCTSSAKLRQAARENGKKKLSTKQHVHFQHDIMRFQYVYIFFVCPLPFVLFCYVNVLHYFLPFFYCIYLLLLEYYPESQVRSRVIS